MKIVDMVERVDRQARYLSGNAMEKGYRFFAALISMNMANTYLSSTEWSSLSKTPDFLAPQTTEEALERQLGLCGNQTSLFIEIMQKLNIPVRDVQLYWVAEETQQTNNHIFPEIKWENKWHMFDVTFGWFPHRQDNSMDVLSYSDVRANIPFATTRSDAHPWTYQYTRRVDIMAPFKTEILGELFNGEGKILVPRREKSDGTIIFDNTALPRAIGQLKTYTSDVGTIAYKLQLPHGKWQLIVELDNSNYDIYTQPRLVLCNIHDKQKNKVYPIDTVGDKIATWHECEGELELRLISHNADEIVYSNISRITATRST